MFAKVLSILALSLFIDLVSCQSYTCVLPGTCTGDLNTGPGIDPRIVTPGNALCPAGLVPCYNTGTTNNCGVRSVPNIDTQSTYATPGAYPWQAYLQNDTNPFAGSGVLVDQYHVITAAHKVYRSVNSPSSVVVRLGVHNPTNLNGPNVVLRNVASIRVNSGFNPSTLKNDIAILRLASPVQLGASPYVNSACLSPTGTSYVGRNCVVSGWGQTAFNTFDAPTNPMKQVNLNIVDYATCRTSYRNILGANVDVYLDGTGGEICAGGENQKDACSQDGGSPLVCPDSAGRFTVAGLVIWGKNCGQPGVYGVYVSIPYYRNWIDTTIAGLNAG